METIAKYELREVLGQGGMGVVYRAYDPLMDREVALKIIQTRAMDVPETRARFVREARMAGRLSHDNIAVIYDLGEADGKTFIAMEYLPGRNLRTIVDAREPLTVQEKLSYAAQICRGLHFAHGNGIIHRDVKPENIQVLPDHRIKIMDFGIAKPQFQGDLAAAAPEAALTTAGVRIGTPWYMSPEQVKGLPVDRRSDIFSLGVLLFELFAHAKPFRGDDTTVLYKIVHEEPEPLQLEDQTVREPLQKVLGKCLAKDPAARYDNCLQLLRDLEEAVLPRNSVSVRETSATTDELPAPAVFSMMPGNFVGETVSHFRILEKIGDGGMGSVYKAEDLTLKRTVALKFLLSEGKLNTRAKERFLLEAQAASALDDPNICTIYEIGETGGGLFFICMSYCPGEDLGKILQKRSLEPQEALSIAIKVARGLSKAHQHGIVHRDIKPANIIVAPSGEAKIVDFGLAKLSGATQFTRIASVMGTLPYMSPEQIKGGDLDHRTDVWSLGVVLYQALTGKLPFEGAYEAALFYAIVNENPPPPSTLNPAVPAVVDAIVAKALAKKVEDRYRTMADLLGELQRARQEVCDILHIDVGSSPEVQTLLENGKLYLERRKYSEALSRFEAALRLSPGHPEADLLRARSVQELAQAEERDALTREAESLMGRGKLREARELLLMVTSGDPQHQQAAELLDRAQGTLERQERVEKLLLDAEFYLKRGRFAEARDCYRKTLDIQPGHKEALRGLKRTEREQELRTDRGIRTTPLPAPGRHKRRIALPAIAAATLLLIAASWFLLRPGVESDITSGSEVQNHSITGQTGNTPSDAGVNNASSAKPANPSVTPPGAGLEQPPDRTSRQGSTVPPEKKRTEGAGTTRGTVEKRRPSTQNTSTGTQKAENIAAPRDEKNVQAGMQSGSKKPGPANPGNPLKEMEPGSALSERTTTAMPDVKSPPNVASADKPAQPPADNEAAARAAAQNQIQKLLQQYRESIERGDAKGLKALLNLPDQALDNWSLFFSSSENRKVTIEGVQMDIGQSAARVNFRTRMSFYNNQTNAPQSTENSRHWTLEPADGTWRIVTQK